MNIKRNVLTVLILIMSAGGAAAARTSEGKLGFIQGPASTRPVFAKPGERIAVDVAQSIYNSCTCAFHAYIVKPDGSRTEIGPAEKVEAVASDTFRFLVAVPPDTAPGLYGFAVHKGSNDDISNRAIMVVAEYPSEYTIMHVSDVHIGRLDGANQLGKDLFEKMAARANELKPDIVIITGDVTDFSDPEQFKTFLEITDKFTSPTVVVPGNHDRNFSNSDQYLGPHFFTFMFGQHFYLGFDTSDHFPPPDPQGKMNWIRSETRAHKDAPFKVLFSHREDSDFRLILSKVLLPYKVNLFLSGHYHAGGEEKIGSVPTYYLIDQAAIEGYYRIIKVKDSKVAEYKTGNVKN